MTKFEIRMGIPEIFSLWNELTQKADNNTLNKTEEKLFKKLVKAFGFLQSNPKHPGLETHEIPILSKRYGQRVWQSYLENKKPSAGRLYWIYGPNQGDITIIGLEPHLNDKKDSYDKITLSELVLE